MSLTIISSLNQSITNRHNSHYLLQYRYLPQDVAEKWNKLFAKMTNGLKYSTRQRDMMDNEVDALPTIIYRLEGPPGSDPIDVEAPSSSYTEHIELKSGRSKKAFRIYTTEKEGAVLGSNFMVGHNVVFDVERRRVGFAKSKCDYSTRGVGLNNNNLRNIDGEGGTAAAAAGNGKRVVDLRNGAPSLSGNGEEAGGGRYPHLEDPKLLGRMTSALGGPSLCGPASTTLVSGCSAMCADAATATAHIDNGVGSYMVEGTQRWAQKPCSSSSSSSSDSESAAGPSLTYFEEKCKVICDNYHGGLSRGESVTCKAEEWSSCSPACEQHRYVPVSMSDQYSSDSSMSIGDISAGVFRFFTKVGQLLTAFGSGSAASEQNSWKDCKRIQEKRACFVHKCGVRQGDNAVVLTFTVSHMRKSAWTSVHREDLIAAVSKTLLLPENIMHGEVFLGTVTEHDTKPSDIEFQIRIRVPKALFADSSAAISERAVEIMKDAKFVDLVAYHLNGDSPSSGAWRWLTGREMLTVKGAAMKKLAPAVTGGAVGGAAGNSKEQVGADPMGIRGAAGQKEKKAAIEAARLRSFKASPINYFTIDYGAYGTPLEWDGVTWMKLFVIFLIQGAAVASFFVMRRAKAMREAQASDPALAFDAFKGVPAHSHSRKKERSRDSDRNSRINNIRSGGALDRRAVARSIGRVGNNK
jgi:hypothetical protein